MKRKRGRPKSDQTHTIDQTFGNLTIIGLRKNDKSGHPMCRTRCHVCGSESTQRTYDVMNSRVRTCGCGSIKAFKRNMKNRLAALSAAQVEKIWCVVQEAPSIAAAARSLKRDKYIVGSAAREHQNRLNSLPEAKRVAIWEAAQQNGIEHALGVAGGLNRLSVGHIVTKMHKALPHPELDEWTLLRKLRYLKDDIDRTPERDEPWFRQGEFHRNDLARKNNGQVTGALSDLYKHLRKYHVSERTDPSLAELIRWFVHTAESTFSNRQDRLEGYRKNLRKERQRDRESDRRLREAWKRNNPGQEWPRDRNRRERQKTREVRQDQDTVVTI